MGGWVAGTLLHLDSARTPLPVVPSIDIDPRLHERPPWGATSHDPAPEERNVVPRDRQWWSVRLLRYGCKRSAYEFSTTRREKRSFCSAGRASHEQMGGGIQNSSRPEKSKTLYHIVEKQVYACDLQVGTLKHHGGSMLTQICIRSMYIRVASTKYVRAGF